VRELIDENEKKTLKHRNKNNATSLTLLKQCVTYFTRSFLFTAVQKLFK